MSSSGKKTLLRSDKIAFLGLFILSLVVARLIVGVRSTTRLSGPVELRYSGVSVYVPVGNGWQGERRWSYQRNGYSLSSQRFSMPGQPSGWLRWRYLLVSNATDGKQRIEARAKELKSRIVRSGRTDSGGVVFDWGCLEPPEAAGVICFATAQLPYKRRLELELRELAVGPAATQRTFNRLLGSVRFEDNGLLEAGSKAVAEIRRRGLSRFLENHNRQSLYLIRDGRGRAIGFTADVFVNQNLQQQMQVKAAGIFYVRSGYDRERVSSFESDDRLRRFRWNTEFADALGNLILQRVGTQVTVEQDGTMTVTSSDPQRSKEQLCLGPVSVPDVLIGVVLEQLVDSGVQRCMLDLIQPDGTVTPVLVHRLELKPETAKQKIAYAFHLLLLDGQGYYERLYLDGNKRIVRAVLQQEDLILFEQAELSEVVRLFPEKAKYLFEVGRFRKDHRQD